MYIFKVSNHDKDVKTLNCQVVLRSNDMFLGSPFNIMSVAILTILISRCVNMNPGKISLNITDAHIYQNHIEQVKEQINRIPYKFPTLQINKNISSYEDICKLNANDFIISDYNYWPKLGGTMAV
jgi:thymidylate synthase